VAVLRATSGSLILRSIKNAYFAKGVPKKKRQMPKVRCLEGVDAPAFGGAPAPGGEQSKYKGEKSPKTSARAQPSATWGKRGKNAIYTK